jgi:hypothetical protein
LATNLQCAPSITTIKRWTRLFKEGRGPVKDDEPLHSLYRRNYYKGEKLVLKERRIWVRQIADKLKIQ